jgi:hypothetical protein
MVVFSTKAGRWAIPLLLAWQTSIAGDAFMVHGAGGLVCRDFLQERDARNPAVVQFAEWVRGYTSAYAMVTEGRVASITRDVALAHLNDYCERHPSDLVVDVAAAIS